MNTKKTGTLSLARKPSGRPAALASGDTPKQRSGDRARRAALRQREPGALPVPERKPASKPARAPDWHADQKPLRKPNQSPPHASPGHKTAGDKTAAHKSVAHKAANRQSTSPKPAGPPRHASAARRASDSYPLFAPCPPGLEAALVAELQALGYADARAGRAGAHFHADWAGVMRANLHSRLATRILVQLAAGPVARENDILNLARSTAWERWFGPEHRLRVDTSAIQSPMHSLHYCNLRAKDGICDRLREREGARPDIDTVRPDARVHLFLSRDAATLYLDSSGESLFKRGWRLDKGVAPLRENLAAGLLALAGWQPGVPFLDPFCGSGTLVIEAASLALNLPPGLNRPFGFERLRGHDAAAWHALKDAARAQIQARSPAMLAGSDSDPQAIASARANAERAGLSADIIAWQQADACTLTLEAAPGHIVTNPPYGERLEAAQASLWRDWASTLKRHYSGWQLAMISNDASLPQQLRLKPRLRTPVRNGALDCRLFQFDLVAAGYRGQ